jgi:hypothetical protein
MFSTSPTHTTEECADGRFVVKVGRHVTGYLSADGEESGIWRAQDQGGRPMGRVRDFAEAAAFIAAWFIAGSDW